MIDTVIVSGGMIQKDFALDFIKKIEKEKKGEKLLLLAADRGLDFFRETGLTPDIADGDFDSLSKEGKAYLESLSGTEIVKLNPEKDDTDTQSTLDLAIEKGAKNILILGATGGRLDHFIGNMGLLQYGRKEGVHVDPGRCAELYLLCGKWTYYSKRHTIRKICFLFCSWRNSRRTYPEGIQISTGSLLSYSGQLRIHCQQRDPGETGAGAL